MARKISNSIETHAFLNVSVELVELVVINSYSNVKQTLTGIVDFTLSLEFYGEVEGNYIKRMYRSISQLPRITNKTNKTEFDWNKMFSL